jgi:hypothetical protein
MSRSCWARHPGRQPRDVLPLSPTSPSYRGGLRRWSQGRTLAGPGERVPRQPDRIIICTGRSIPRAFFPGSRSVRIIGGLDFEQSQPPSRWRKKYAFPVLHQAIRPPGHRTRARISLSSKSHDRDLASCGFPPMINDIRIWCSAPANAVFAEGRGPYLRCVSPCLRYFRFRNGGSIVASAIGKWLERRMCRIAVIRRDRSSARGSIR